jgi:hypothetical protein
MLHMSGKSSPISQAAPTPVRRQRRQVCVEGCGCGVPASLLPGSLPSAMKGKRRGGGKKKVPPRNSRGGFRHAAPTEPAVAGPNARQGALPAARAPVVLRSAPTSTRGRRASGHLVREARPAGRCCGDACRGESCLAAMHRVPAVPVPSLPTVRRYEGLHVLLIGTRLSLSVPGMGFSPQGSTHAVIWETCSRQHLRGYLWAGSARPWC